MSDNPGKRANWIISVLAILLLAGGYYWYRATRPTPVKHKPLAIVGVGLYLGRDQETHKFVIRKIFVNSPAAKAGIAPGVFLNKVGDSLAETNNIKGLSKLLTGPIGTTVTLELLDTNGETSQVTLMREQFLNRATNSP